MKTSSRLPAHMIIPMTINPPTPTRWKRAHSKCERSRAELCPIVRGFSEGLASVFAKLSRLKSRCLSGGYGHVARVAIVYARTYT